MMSGFRAIPETLILAIIVAAGNALFGASDPGWLSINPTPYLVIPMLVGMRYGFMAGLVSGLVTAAAIVAGAAMFGGASVSEILAKSTFTVMALPAVGILAGEVRRALASRSSDTADQATTLQTEVSRLKAELDLSNEAQSQLQEQLALHGAKFSSVDLELRKRFEGDAGPVLPGTLEALAALCDVESAAFYRRESGGKLKLDCTRGDASRFDELLEGADAEMASAALDSGELATPHKLLDAGRAAGSCIAALPWSDDLVLVIGDMPFESVSWQNFARMETYCRWVAETAKSVETDGVLEREALRERFDLATKTVAKHGVPSTVVVFTVAAGLAGSFDQAALQSAVLPQLAGADVAGTLGRDEPHLAVLLPMSGAREAGRLVESAGEELNGESFVIRSAESAEEIWKALVDVA